MTDEYSAPGSRNLPGWADRLREYDHDPVRFLLSASDAPDLVKARIRGIDFVDTALLWIYCERRLGTKRSWIIAELNKQIQYLREVGERPDRATGERTPTEPKDVVYVKREFEDGEVVDRVEYTPEEWHSRSATSKVADITSG